MATERHRFLAPSTPFSARYIKNEALLDPGRASGQEQSSSSTDSSPSGLTQDPYLTEATKSRTGIPTIEITDSGDDRGSPDMSFFKAKSPSPKFGSNSPAPSRHRQNLREGSSGSKLATLKRKTYQVLAFGHEKDGDKGKEHEDGLLRTPLADLPGSSSVSPTWKRRAVSMPEPNAQKQARMGISHHADPVTTRSYLASGSPPIVDFTRFEDRYRSPSSDYDGFISVSKGNKSDVERKAMSWLSLGKREVKNEHGELVCSKAGGCPEHDGRDCGKVPGVGANEAVCNPSGKRVLYPARERKPDPRLIVDALEKTSDRVDIRQLLNIGDLLRIHDVDQQNFDLRDGGLGPKSRTGETRSVFGESIQNVFRYASTMIVLGEREYILPILVVHCVEEVYRTGIYQSNLFRTLPNRPRLHQLISIFDSEEQPAGSIIRSRQSSSSSSSLEGFGAATSLHLESTPDICALLTSYLSALPEPLLPANLFEAIWQLCGVDTQFQADSPKPRTAPTILPDSPAPVRLSSVLLARSYTPRSEATHTLIAQLFLHLLPSPHFFLFLYLLSFFSQVALVREENGVGIDDLSKMFGARIFGHGYDDTSMASLLQPSLKFKAKGKEKEKNGRGEIMMGWFLRRWGPLSETLFEVVDDAKFGVLHQNKHVQEGRSGKAAMKSAFIAVREALSAHDAVESEVRDSQEDGERDDEVEDLVEREISDDWDDVDLPEPVNIVRSPPTVHVPVAEDLREQGLPSSVSFVRKGSHLLPVAQGNTSTRKGSSESSSVSSGSSSSTLPPYTARPSSNTNAIESDFNCTVPRRLPPDHLPSRQPEICLSEASLSGDEKLFHSTPKKDSVGNRTADRIVGDTDHSAEESRHSRVMAAQLREEGGTGNVGAIDQSVDDGESTHSLSSLHERLLDVSMPVSIFDFDETMPSSGSLNQNPLVLNSGSTLSVTPTEAHEPHPAKIIGRNLAPRTTSVSGIRGSALSNGSSGTLPLSLNSNRCRSSIPNIAFLSPSPAVKNPEHLQTHSQPRLPISRSLGFQKQPDYPVHSTPAIAVINPGEEPDTNEKDGVINALRERLVEVEKERDEARRIVKEVKRALRRVEDDS